MRAFAIPAGGFPAGPRGVETSLVRQAMPWVAVIAPVALVVSWFVDGVDGLASAAIGVAFGVGNLFASAFLLERAARRGGQYLMAAAVGGFVGRFVLLTVVVFGLMQFAFVNVAILGFVLVGTHLALLTIEAITLSRAEPSLESIIPKMRTSAIDMADEELR